MMEAGAAGSCLHVLGDRMIRRRTLTNVIGRLLAPLAHHAHRLERELALRHGQSRPHQADQVT